MVDTLERCARAIAEVREKYWYKANLTKQGVFIYDIFSTTDVVYFTGTDPQCQAWIRPRSRTRLCAALLPVDDKDFGISDAMVSKWAKHGPYKTSGEQVVDTFTAALTTVLEGRRDHGKRVLRPLL